MKNDHDTTTPLVTIGIPTYNCARYLRESLDSIARQTYKNVEVIISDNASSDDTTDILKEYRSKYGWRLALNETNTGPGNNFNRLVGLARGEYLAIYHADDVYDPRIVAESVRAFGDYPELGIVGTLSTEIDALGRTLKTYRLPDPIVELHRPWYSFDETLLGIVASGYDAIFLVTPSVMVKSSVYRQLGGFRASERYRSALDYEMWVRAAAHFRVAVLDQHLIRYRIHGDQGSELEIRKNIEVHDIVNVLTDYLAQIQDQAIQAQVLRYIDRSYLSAALRQNRCELFHKSSETLAYVRQRYCAAKYLLLWCNLFKINLGSGAVGKIRGFLRPRVPSA
jgi:glycosyltransferase involved in cell wall biosynthesis